MARQPTAEEKARMEKGPRYDPSRPQPPWGQRGGGGGGGGGERIPPPGWEERGLEKGWPTPFPIPPPPPMEYDWAMPGLGFWERGLEKGWPPPPPTQAPIIPEPGMEAWQGRLPPWFERGGRFPPSTTAWGLEPVVPWPERGARPPAGELALEANIDRWRQEYSAQTPITLPEGYLEGYDYEERLNQYDQQLRDLQAQYEAKKSEVLDLTIEENQKASALAQLAQWYAQSQAAIAQAKAEVEAKIPELQNLQWERHDWLLSQAYGKTVFDPETGRQLSWNEVERLARTNPYMPIVEVLALGGGDTLESDMTIADLVATYTPEDLAALAEEEALGIKTKAEEQIEAGLERRKDEILTSDLTYDEKLQAVLKLYGGTAGGPAFWELREAVINSLSPEEREKQMQEEPTVFPAQKWGEEEAKVDVGALGKMLSPYGINLIGNYPFISPITEAHLMRLPPDVIEQMQKYLSEKDLSWRDFLEISASWYGGAGVPRGAWAVPRQY